MKFLVSKNFHSNATFKLLIAFYTVLLFFYFLGDLFYLGHFFGSDTLSVLSTLKGNEEEYIEPLDFIVLLEHMHISLFLGIISLFTTMAIVLRLSLRNTHKHILIIMSMSSLLLSFLALFAVYFVSDIFVYGFFYGTIAWHALGMYALLLIFKELWWTKA